VRFALNLCVGATIVSLFVGFIAVNMTSVLFFIIVLPMAFMIDFCGNFLVGLAAFWIEDTVGLQLIYSRLTMILGGMLIPLELFPASWQPLLQSLPFAAVVYGPARLFVAPQVALLQDVLWHQIAAVIVLSAAVAVVYRTASARVFTNGG
jgi:ABC-2 type transport system permease protein